MPYVTTGYMNNSAAPIGLWTCAPSSLLGPFKEPPLNDARGSDLCGQCVSYVKQVCKNLPQTSAWKKGEIVKGNTAIKSGTVIATFNNSGKYEGHAAIYVGQDVVGIHVYDQYITGVSPKPVGPRTLRWGAAGRSNNGDLFYVVEPM